MRASGIILHISSLPTKYGIGRFGKEAYEFVDFLEKSNQRYWQILPLSPTSFGDSPYQSFSIFAGNPYFIDLTTLENEGLLEENDYKLLDWGDDENFVSYSNVFDNTFPVLKKSFVNFKKLLFNKSDNYIAFCEKNNNWLESYGLFMALKFENNGASWDVWDEELIIRKPEALKKAKSRLADEIEFFIFSQFKFFEQWEKLKAYANQKGIEIIGDVPIYVAYDSVDVWENPELFMLDKEKKPIEVAGCPPDDFTPLGQLWGNPLYNWATMKECGYKWWIDRISFAKSLYNVIRIDHFRGFDSFYAIPAKDKTAQFGEWKKGPGIELFKAISNELGKLDIIAEDLGFVTKSVKRLLKQSGYPGMKMLQFAFSPDADSDYLPCNFKNTNCVVYTGTHDSDTINGWVSSMKRKELTFCKNYLGVNRKKDIAWALVKSAWESVAEISVTQMQDILELGSEARMNIPSTVGTNWRWRTKAEYFTYELAQRLDGLTRLYNRNTRKINRKG